MVVNQSTPIEEEKETIDLDEDIEAELDAVLNEEAIPNVEETVTSDYKPPTVAQTNESLIREVLDNKSPEYRSAVLRVAYQAGVEKDDPLFAVLLATGQLELLLEKKPEEIRSLFQEWQTILRQEREEARVYLDEVQATLERESRAAIKVQKRRIAESVKYLVRHAAYEKVAHDLPALIRAGCILFLAVGLGTVLGLAIPKFAPEPILDPAGKRQLTLEEAQALQWAMSPEGQFAQVFMDWNQSLLSGGRQKLCEQDAKQLGVTLELEGRKATGGFCTLWIRPPEERAFVE